MRAFLFPGQGSQHVGMGQELAKAYPAAKAVFEEVDATLKQPLSKIMFEGPEGRLTLTENAQPALMAVSIAAVRVLEAKGFPLTEIAQYVAGHSLGEYSALAAAGAISLSDAAKLLKRRGLAMQRAVPEGRGAMAALLGLDLATAQAVAKEASSEGKVCAVANDNAPGQVVVSGHKQAVESAIEIAKEKGAKRGVLLPVSAPFHCPLMEPAAQEMARALAGVDIYPPKIPVVSNVTAGPVSDPEEIRSLLTQQVTGMVRWQESVKRLSALGVFQVVECGAGKVLSGLAKRIDPSLDILNIATPADIEEFFRHIH